MYGRMPHQEAIALALADPPVDPLLGVLSTTHLQLCPQNRGRVGLAMIGELRRRYPGVQFRLHANVQLGEKPRIVDWCDWPQEQAWFHRCAILSCVLGASAYTAHAGRRQCSVAAVLNHVRDAEQAFGIPVGIEGHYPTRRHDWLISTWAEYRQMLESGVHYALDMSHLHILAVQSGRVEVQLVADLLASDQCLEIHVSANDGAYDQHLPLQAPPWWWSLLANAHPDAVIFSEGRQRPAA
jgi:hypothetical protein